MFRFVGWLVVTGFTLYGLGRFVGEHVVLEKPKNAGDGWRDAR